MKTNVYFIAMFDDLVIYDNLDSSCYCPLLILLSSGFYPKNRIPVGGARFVDFT